MLLPQMETTKMIFFILILQLFMMMLILQFLTDGVKLYMNQLITKTIGTELI